MVEKLSPSFQILCLNLKTCYSSQDWNGLKSTAKTVEKPITNAEQHWNLILWPQKCRVHKWNQICISINANLLFSTLLELLLNCFVLLPLLNLTIFQWRFQCRNGLCMPPADDLNPIFDIFDNQLFKNSKIKNGNKTTPAVAGR